MIDQKVLDKLEEDFNLTKGKNDFKLSVNTEKGSGIFFFSERDGNYYCGYQIKNSDGEVIDEKATNFEENKASAKAYLVRICYTVVSSKLGLDI